MSFATYPSLAGRVVLVTGGASGIGADIVRAFAGQGSKIAFLDIMDEAAVALCDELAAAAPLYLRCDLTDVDALKAAIGTVREKLGPIGVLVNNAGNDDRRAIDAVTVDYWDKIQAINLRAQFFAAQAVHPQMRELGDGSIINFSSIVWRLGADTMPAYATAKAAIHGMTGSLAKAFGADGIRVNTVEPGAVMTDKQLKLWYTEQAQVDAMIARQMLKRVLLADEVARAVLFLAADDSRMITKQTIRVDAGLR